MTVTVLLGILVSFFDKIELQPPHRTGCTLAQVMALQHPAGTHPHAEYGTPVVGRWYGFLLSGLLFQWEETPRVL